MAENPIDIAIDGQPVSKAAVRGYEKQRVRQRVANADEIRNTKFSGQFGGLYKADTKTNFDIDAADTTTPDDPAGVTCIVDADGNRWKPVSSIPAPTNVSLGGVFAHTPESSKFLTGIGTDGSALSAQPSASDLSNGVEGTGAVVLKSYADGLIAANDAMVLKGVIDCSGNPNYPAADRGWTYRVSVAGKIGGVAGAVVELGDILLCLADGTAAGDQATVGAYWGVIQVNIDGAVTLTGAQVLTNKTIDGASNNLNVRLGSDVSGNLPNANLATMVNLRFKGNVSGGTATPSDVSASQILDAIGSTRGAILIRGVSGWVVLAPGTNGQVLTSAGAGADPSYQDATGGGGGIPDTERRNAILDRIYQSKILTQPRRVINSWTTGFANASAAANGINTGASASYAVDAANGRLIPVFADVYVTEVSTAFNENSAGWSNYTLRLILPPGIAASGDRLRLTLTPPTSGASTVIGDMMLAHPGSGSAFDGTQARVQVGASNGFTLTTGGSLVVTDPVVYAYDSTKPLMVAIRIVSGDLRRNVGLTSGYQFYAKAASVAADATGTNPSGFGTATSGRCDVVSLVEARTVAGGAGFNVTTTMQATDANVSNVRALLEIDDTAAGTLDTDLKVEVTCNAGGSWHPAALATTGKLISQSGRKMIETVDQACTAGTSFGARLTSYNNKLIPAHGLGLTAH